MIYLRQYQFDNGGGMDFLNQFSLAQIAQAVLILMAALFTLGVGLMVANFKELFSGRPWGRGEQPETIDKIFLHVSRVMVLLMFAGFLVVCAIIAEGPASYLLNPR